ncbi:Uncharacterized protein PBTT_01545 [Plasmodiophora brassicae]
MPMTLLRLASAESRSGDGDASTACLTAALALLNDALLVERSDPLRQFVRAALQSQSRVGAGRPPRRGRRLDRVDLYGIRFDADRDPMPYATAMAPARTAHDRNGNAVGVVVDEEAAEAAASRAAHRRHLTNQLRRYETRRPRVRHDYIALALVELADAYTNDRIYAKGQAYLQRALKIIAKRRLPIAVPGRIAAALALAEHGVQAPGHDATPDVVPALRSVGPARESSGKGPSPYEAPARGKSRSRSRTPASNSTMYR